MKKKRSLSDGPCADTRNALVAKIKETEADTRKWRELFVALLEVYPADAHNIYTAGKGAAGALINAALEIMEMVKDMAPGDTTLAQEEVCHG